MADDPLMPVRMELRSRMAAIEAAGTRLSPRALHGHMDAIRALAAAHGLVALEGLARNSAQRALLPGRRMAMRSCFEHFIEALDSQSEDDRTSILAAVALRLH